MLAYTFESEVSAEAKKGAARGINEAAFVTIKTRKAADFFKTKCRRGTEIGRGERFWKWKLAFIS